ncbi:MAG: 3-deoxy-manno-octulosonate cytidylyltransferase [Verrucomicrobiota bacterium]
MSIAVIIPARFASQRFPGKVLAPIAGKPLIQWVWENAKKAPSVSQVIVATDHQHVVDLIKGLGGEAVMTPSDLPSGTDRIAVAAEGLDCDWVINVQGDEPLFSSNDLEAFIEALEDYPMATLARRMSSQEDVSNPNVVKVAIALDGRALYFSREPIPHHRDGGDTEFWHHLGVYAYRPSTLRSLVQWDPSPLEQKEKLEQLRALENGISIQVVSTSARCIGVDTPEDLRQVEEILELAPDNAVHTSEPKAE